jgi:hypothetical protein
MDVVRSRDGALRAVGFVVVLAGVSAGAWAGWGVVAWAVVMSAGAGWLFWRAFGPRRSRVDRRAVWEPLVAVTELIEPFEAELACQALEARGIRSTYYGRANPDGRIPGGGIRLADWVGKVRVEVIKHDRVRAAEVLRELPEPIEQDALTVDSAEPQQMPSGRAAVSPGREAAMAAFGERPTGVLSTLARRILG